MATISQIITDAFNYNNLVALAAIPSAQEQAKALRILNRIFDGVFGHEIGDPFRDYEIGNKPTVVPSEHSTREPLDSPYLAPFNSRISFQLSAPVTVYLNPYPQNGERFSVQDIAGNFATHNVTINGNGKRIENAASLVLDTNSIKSEWLFRSDTGNWHKIADLTLEDEFPLPERFEEFFIISLNMRLNAGEDVDMNEQLLAVLRSTAKKMKAEYRLKKTEPLETGLQIVSGQLGWIVDFENGRQT